MSRVLVGGLGLAAALAQPIAAITISAPREVKSEARQRRPPMAIYAPPPRLNRSRHWAYADSYENARRISPFPHRPVR